MSGNNDMPPIFMLRNDTDKPVTFSCSIPNAISPPPSTMMPGEKYGVFNHPGTVVSIVDAAKEK